jgi:DNA polymerase III subunit delta
MTIVKPAQIDALLRRPSTDIAVFLVFGPDQGLVSERVKTLAANLVADINHPFQLVKMGGDQLVQEPSRLLDEVSTISFFAEKRAIWIKNGLRSLHSVIESFLKEPCFSTPIIIEAADLAKTSRAYTIACYVEEGRNLAEIITATLRENEKTISFEALEFLKDHLGQDRLATKGELNKLCLYTLHQTKITLTDVMNVTADISPLATDQICDALLTLQKDELDRLLSKFFQENGHSGLILSTLLRHMLMLLTKRLDIEEGKSINSVVEDWRGLFFKRKSLVTRELQLWTSQKLSNGINIIQTIMLKTRQNIELDQALIYQMCRDMMEF